MNKVKGALALAVLAGIWWVWGVYGAASLLCLVPIALIAGLGVGFNQERRGPAWWHGRR